MKRAVYPGTFDPVTFGHIDLIKRAQKIFDQVIVAVVRYPEKQALFTISQRVKLVEQATQGLNGITVESFDGLIVDYVQKKKSCTVIRGLRMLSDFEYEFQMALTNRKLSQAIETIFMMPQESYAYLSSRLIKEVARLGGDVRAFVPDFVASALKKKLNNERKEAYAVTEA